MIELLRSGPRRAGEIAAAFPSRGPTISRHLRVLRTSGLIEATGMPEDARARIYQLRAEPFAELGAWLEQVQNFWSAKLGAFKTHIERR